MKRQGFTLTELLVTVIIMAILVSLATVRYSAVAEKGRAAEAELIMEKVRAGYQAELFAQTLPGGWDPGIDATTDAQWRAVGLSNPNASPNAFFAIDVWPPAVSAGSVPVSAARNVVIAFHRNPPLAAYSASYDTNKWLYMDLDTGRVTRSATYQ